MNLLHVCFLFMSRSFDQTFLTKISKSTTPCPLPDPLFTFLYGHLNRVRMSSTGHEFAYTVPNISECCGKFVSGSADRDGNRINRVVERDGVGGVR